MNLFDAAVANQKPKAKGKSKQKLIVPIDVKDKITKLLEVRADIANLEAKETDLKCDIWMAAEEKYLDLYSAGGRPESFILQSTDGGKCMLLLIDKYEKVEEAKEQTIQELYGDQASEILETATEFKFNDDMLRKHGAKIKAAISEAIMGLDIPDEDKPKVVKATTTVAIKKGVIDRLDKFKDWKNLFRLIKPQVQLKNPGTA